MIKYLLKPLVEEIIIEQFSEANTLQLSFLVSKIMRHDFNKTKFSIFLPGRIIGIFLSGPSDLISISEDSTVHMYDIADNKAVSICTLTSRKFHLIQVSGNGRFLALSSGSEVTLYCVASAQVICQWQACNDILDICFSKDNKLLVASDKERLHVYDIFTVSEGISQKCPGILRIFMSGNCKYLAGVLDLNAIRVFHLYKHAKSFPVLEGHEKAITCLQFIEKSCKLISGSADNQLKLWDFTTGVKLQSFIGHISPVTCIAFSSENLWVLSGSKDATVKLWDLCENNLNFTFEGHSDGITCIEITKDNHYFISGSEDTTVRIWNIFEKNLEFTLTNHSSPLSHILLSPNNSLLITASSEGKVHCIFLQAAKDEKILQTHNANLNCVSISKSRRFLVTGSEDTSVKVWDTHLQKNVLSVIEHTELVNCVTITDNGKFFASGSNDNTIIVWDIENNSRVNCLRGHTSGIYCIDISDDGKYLASASLDSTIKIWDIYTATYVEISDNTHWVNFLAFTKDFLISSSEESIIKVWDLDRGLEKFSFRHEKTNCLLITNSGKFVVTGSEDNTIKIWDIEIKNSVLMSGQKNLYKSKKKSLFHDGGVTCMAISDDDEVLVTGAKDLMVKVWDFEAEREVVVLAGHRYTVTCVAISSDKKFCASASQDYRVKLWNLGEKRVEADFPMHTPVFFLSLASQHVIICTKVENSLYFSGFAMPAATSHLNSFHNLDIFAFLVTLQTEKLPIPSQSPILFSQLRLNLAHFYSYTGQDAHLKLALDQGCDIRTDSLNNSPLHYALLKNSHTCRDKILQFLIDLQRTSSNPHKFLEYTYAIRNDFESILKSSSMLSPKFLEAIFIVVHRKDLPQYVTPKKSLPMLVQSKYRGLDVKDFVWNETEGKARYLVRFRSAVLPLELTKGSKGCQDLFNAMLSSQNAKVFRTPLIRKIIKHKWESLRSLILAFTCLLWLNLAVMILLITEYTDVIGLNLVYFFINVVLLTQEIFQVVSLGLKEYLLNLENILDVIRLGSCFVWLGLNITSVQMNSVTWTMVLCNFIKGIIGFRAFDNTRFYVRLIFTAFKDSYSFIFLICYSTLAFGVLYYASLPERDHSLFKDFWKIPYELSLGNFSNSDHFNLEYSYFILASLVNIIMMLNLLISILGDSFDKFQLASIEIDYKEMVEVILEIESIFLWRKGIENQEFFSLCEEVKACADGEEWEGKIKVIEGKIEEVSKQISEEFGKVHWLVQNKFEAVDLKLDKLCRAVHVRKNSF